jgi:uncharacterized LabA/DUF88 family protein
VFDALAAAGERLAGAIRALAGSPNRDLRAFTEQVTKLAEKLDVIVLVTGDGDFLPLVSYLQNTKGCLVEVMAFRQTASSRLVEESDDFINMSDNRKYLR